jgi:WD40 repeat protein/uncharacterized caspase-like protein
MSIAKSRFIFLIVALMSSGFIPLAARAQQTEPSIGVVPNLGQSPVSVALSPDGKLLAVGNYDGSIQLWDFGSARLLRTLVRHSQEVRSVVFVASGKQIVSAGKDMTVKLWDVTTGELLRTAELRSPAEYMWDIQLSPDGTQVASAQTIKGSDPAGIIKLWDAATGQLIRSIRASPMALAFTPDGKRLVSGGNGVDHKGGSQVTFWDLTNGRLLRSFDHTKFAGVYKVAVSADGSRIMSASTGTNDNVVKLWDASTGRNLQTLVHPEFVESLAFSPDGNLAVTCDRSFTTRVWDIRTGKQLIASKKESMSAMASFLPDGTHALVADIRVEMIDVASGNIDRTFGSHRAGFSQATFTAGGNEIITSGEYLRRWDSRSGQLLEVLARAPDDKTYSEDFTADASRVVWRLGDFKTLKVVDVKSGRVLSTLTHSTNVSQARLSPDGREVLSTSYDKQAKLWDADSGRLLRTFTLPDNPYSVAFSPDGSRILAGAGDGTIKMWNKSTGQQLWSYKEPGSNAAIVWTMRFSADGSKVLAAISENAPKLLDATTGRLIRAFNGHKQGYIVSGAYLSPDSTKVISTSHDETAKLWDVASGRLLHTFEVGYVNDVAFTPDGSRVLLNGDLWDLRTYQKIATWMSSSETDWLAITSEGYFAGTERGADILSVVRGLDVWSVDQFYQSLYRPDLVREKLAGDPRGLVRQAVAGLDLDKAVASGGAPDVRVTLPGRALGSGTADGSSVQAEAEIVDRGGGIGRIEWRVNGVTAGIDKPATGSPSPLRLTRTLALDAGDNSIEVVAYNGADLISSAPARVTVAAQAPSAAAPAAPSAQPSAPVAAAKPRLFVLVAGVNDYADKRFKLAYAVSDASEVARGFRESAGELYQSVEVKLMTDAEVTRDRLDAVFGEIERKVSASDVFVLYLAGHGKTVDGRYYFVPQDFAVEGELSENAINAAVKTRAIAQDQWQRWFASVPARKSVILFDTCDSGTLAGDETQQLEKGAANDRLAQATGRSILAASGGSQEALEGYHGHGLFTYEVLDAINQADGDRNGTVEVSELAAYVYAQVAELSQKVFKQRQVPQMRITANYPLAKRTRVLQDAASPVAEAKPAWQLAQTAQLRIQPGAGGTVVRSLSAKTAVTVLESNNGWSLIAADGKPIGYVATRDLAPVQ